MQRWIKWTAIAAVPVLLIGTGVAFAATDTRPFGIGDDAPITGTELDRATTAALDHVGEGDVVHTENRDDDSNYEVDVRTRDGRIVELELNDRFDVVESDTDNDTPDTPDADDRLLTSAERDRAVKAAIAHVGSGDAIDVDAGDGPSSYEVEVRTKPGTTIDVHLDAKYRVIGTDTDVDDRDDRDDLDDRYDD